MKMLNKLKQCVIAAFIAVLAMGTYAQHYGLFVGINEYSLEYGASSLSGCVKDVANFSTMCTTHGEWTNENIVKLTDSGATKSAVRGAITELAAKAVAGDTVLLFYSSHGGQIADKDVFLCTHDDDYYDYELAEDLSKFKSGVKLVVVIDACHSGGLFKSASKPKWNLASSVASHMKSAMAKKSAKGIKSDTISDSEIGWITAADYDEYSWDGNKGGLFTTEMLDGWANGDADFDASGDVTFLELFDYAQFVAEDDGTVAQCLNDTVLESVVAGDVGGVTLLIDEDKVLTGFLGLCPANLVIPDGVVAIAESAFDADYNDVENLESVTIPASVTNIGNYAFWGCSNLKKVEGGANLERVGYSAFNDTLFLYGADSWDEVYENEDYDNGYGLDLVYVGDFIVGKRGSINEAWDFEIYDKNGNWLWEYDLEIPGGTTGMADGLFSELPLTSVKIPGSVKRIPEYTFGSCCYLKDLTINEGVEEIEASAFECAGCEWYEDGITTLTIPSSVTKIGEYAFADFGYLKYVIGLDDTDDVHVDAFESTLYRYGWESPMLVIEGTTVTGIEWETRFDDGCVTNGVLCIPQSVTNIADWALSGAYGFHKVILPNTLLALGEGAFDGCHELEEVEIPASIKRISEYAFASCCNLKSLVINEGVEEIGAYAFECAGCEWGLDTLVIPSSVTKIGEYAFAGFGYLKYVTGLDDTDDIHSDAFAGTPFIQGWDAPLLVIEDGVAIGFNWETRFDDGCITNGVFTIPEGVTNIAENAFSGVYEFNKVILPASLRSIGEEAFGGCEELREVEGGNNLERVGRDVFEETLFLYGADSWDEVWENEDYDNGYGLDFVYVGNFIVGKRGSLAEAWNSEYEDEDGNWVWEYDLDIYEGTTGMADGLFSELPITSVTIPGSVKRIPECAFASCCYLKYLTINEGVKEIEASAFECAGCNWGEGGITTLTIPSSVTKIGEYAFAYFGYLKYVTGLDDTDEVHSDAFAGTPCHEGWEAPVLRIEDGVVRALEWETRFDDGCIIDRVLTIPEGVTGIFVGAFMYENGFDKVILPSSLREIGNSAFYGCEELRKVEGGENLEYVAGEAFEETLFLYGADSWDEVYENEDYEYGYGLDLVYIGNFIVGKRGYLEEAWDSEYEDEDGNWVWEYDLVIPEGTTGIANWLFTDMPITSVTIPGSIKTIPFWAFSGSYIKNLILDEGVEEIDSVAFYGCESLRSVILPSTVKNVRDDAFGDCKNLKNVTFKSEDIVFDARAFRVSIPIGEPNEYGHYDKLDYSCSTNLNPLVFEKVGHSLVGWRTEAINGADKALEAFFDADDLTPFASPEYCGEWAYDEQLEAEVGYNVIPVIEKNKYLIEFDSNGGLSVDNIEVAYDSAYGELPVPERTGYTFAGWYNGETLVTSETVAGVGNQSLVAKWTVNKYTLTFDVAGGSSIDSVEVTFGSKYGELPVTERTGYTFAGWYNGEALVTSETVAGVGNQSLVAKWTANKYTLTFDVAGGSSIDSVEVTFGSKYGELPVTERTGYTFAGWYNGEALVTSETVAGVGNQSLVAKWTANKYTIKYDSNGGEGSMLNQVLTYDVASILNPCAFDRSGYEFIGWALSPTSDSIAYQDRASVKNLISENDGSLTLYALWDRTTLWTPPVSDDGTSGGETPEVGGDEFTGEYAEVYDGYICDDDIVIGTIQAKTAKAKKGISKVTVSIQIAGEKKLTLKGEMAVEDAEFEAVAKDGRVLVLQFGLNGIFGDFDGYLIDGAKNFFSSKDKTEKAEAEDILESYFGAYTMVCDDGNLSITIAKKGKVTIKGVIGGNKVSAKAQTLIGADVICIPVVYSKKSLNLAFTIYLPLDGGEAEVVGLDNAIIGKAGTLKDGAKFIIDGDIGASIETEDSRTFELLPNNETITVSKSKWLVAGGIKAAKVAYKKGEFTITEGKKGAGIVNPSGLKLSYKSKDGSFTGSFTAYAIVKGKLKKHKATIEGVLVNGIGYGTITIKKIGTWGVTIE